jgi:glycosyltransferase involved in cell wall biosynthesis
LPIKTWNTTFTNEISAEHRKYGWYVDVLPVPLSPFLNEGDYNRKAIDEINPCGKKYDRLICWLLVTRREQGSDLLQKMIDDGSTVNLPQKFIKCFVSEKMNVLENDNIELVSIPLGSKDYYLRFNECDVVLLPYSAHPYNRALSMVFVEAVATGKVPIVSDGTVMASELRRFNLGDLVLDFDNEFSWTGMNKIRDSVSLRERLNFMAACYARDHDTFAYAESLYRCLKQKDPEIALAEPKRL